ncbi:hypothetical protein CRENBAI_020465, partial [Crenichthys baileyi]
CVPSSYLPLCNTHLQLVRRLRSERQQNKVPAEPTLSHAHAQRGYFGVASPNTMEGHAHPHKDGRTCPKSWQESVNMTVCVFKCVCSVTKGFQSHNKTCACVMINTRTKEVCPLSCYQLTGDSQACLQAVCPTFPQTPKRSPTHTRSVESRRQPSFSSESLELNLVQKSNPQKVLGELELEDRFLKVLDRQVEGRLTTHWQDTHHCTLVGIKPALSKATLPSHCFQTLIGYLRGASAQRQDLCSH